MSIFVRSVEAICTGIKVTGFFPSLVRWLLKSCTAVPLRMASRLFCFLLPEPALPRKPLKMAFNWFFSSSLMPSTSRTTVPS